MSLDFLLQLALFAAFLLNLAFLFRFLRSSAAGLSRKYLAAVAAFALLCLAAFWGVSSGLPVRSGYDNGHDAGYLSASAFPPGDCGLLRAGKEASPLIFDLAADLLSGYSLAAHPVKNSLLIWAAAMVFGLFLRSAGLEPPAAAAGALLICFNSLGLLNASSMTTTGANMFYFASALLAAARFCAEPSARNSAWAAASLFLLMAARVELFVVPALLSLGALWFSAKRGGALPKTAPAALLCLLLCGLWWYRLQPYWVATVGPSGSNLLDLAQHAAWELGATNLSIMFGTPAGLAPLLLAGGLAFCAAAAFRLGRAALPWLTAGLAAWLAYFTAIFFSADLYPLHFMRHQLYYFVPVAALAALCLHCLLLLSGGRRPAATGLAALLMAFYSAAGIKGAYAQRGEYRTNDREWRLLIRAQRELPDCGVYYHLSESRRGLLAKYFGAGAGSPVAGKCMARYVSPAEEIFASARGRGWGAPSGAPLLSEEFPHRFYTTMSADETRDPVGLKIGFFLLGEGPEKASLLAAAAIRDIRRGDFAAAYANAAEAARTDPAGKLPNLAAASAAALFGQGAEAGGYMKAAGIPGLEGADGEFLRLAASGEWCAARAAAERSASGGTEDVVLAARAVSGGLNFLIGDKPCGR